MSITRKKDMGWGGSSEKARGGYFFPVKYLIPILLLLVCSAEALHITDITDRKVTLSDYSIWRVLKEDRLKIIRLEPMEKVRVVRTPYTSIEGIYLLQTEDQKIKAYKLKPTY